MDVVKHKAKKQSNKKYLMTGAALLCVSILGWVALKPDGERKIQRNDIVTAQVQRGTLQAEITGFGVLRSNSQKLITARYPATIDEVVLKPGARVTPESVILRMSNPEMEQELERSLMALSKEEANLKRLALDNKRELLTESSKLSELRAEYKKLALKKAAETELVEKGIVSRLSYNTTVLEYEQLQESIDIQENRMAQLKLVHEQAYAIQEGQMEQQKAQHQAIQDRVNRLTVKAGMSGILQRSPVELGQSVIAGQELALVGSEDDLVGLIKVSQSQAERVQIGQAATVKIRNDQVAAKVQRITPEVQDGMVEVEVAFVAELSSSARPELSVDAKIFTKALENTLYIERPVNVRTQSTQTLFKLDDSGDAAYRAQVTFGEDAGRYLQITSGAKLGDIFILSDMASFKESKTIGIIN
ncbi:RND transporter [Pseudoalteromonas rubra]|uniref:RND transporter n=1 Tax=Pseudoalteromonas rubra TaxID=43658 RepID=A0A5S3WL40_9GAMM|nr:HlyD family efflux transporter periplasmic adaptor subunit [Pseudoalteromonas rubra]TMP28287.1 RND transporter [Pseudoalteromonas rubra]TMP28327.1 RND transporter [Pseudoalteromonas rubra]